MKTDTRNDYVSRVSDALRYIHGHLDDELSLDALADVACFSRYHFHRIFRGMVGAPVKEYVRQLRLKRAAWELASTQRTVIAIALDAGYETHESFTRAFGAIIGNSPSEYRKRFESVGIASSSAASFPFPEPESIIHFNEGGQAMKPEIKRIEAMNAVCVRHIGPYDQCGPAWEAVCAFAGKNGLMGPNAKMIGISYDDPMSVPPEKLRYDACVAVDKPVKPEGNVKPLTIPAGEYAVFRHNGAYSELIKTYGAIFGGWLPQSGREVDDRPCFEVYLNSSCQVPESELQTDIYIALKS